MGQESKRLQIDDGSMDPVRANDLRKPVGVQGAVIRRPRVARKADGRLVRPS
jgi:hypothetical protein